MKKSNPNPIHGASVQKTTGEAITVSLNVFINVPEEKMMLAEVLQSAIIKQIEGAHLPVEPGTYMARVLVSLTK